MQEIKMDRVKVFKDYFIRNRHTIEAMLGQYTKQGLTISVWSAGVRTRAFLELYDPNGTNISFIYDLDREKYGTSLASGHKIVDYHDNPADIVFLTNFDYQVEATHLLHAVKSRAQIVNLDSIILGDLSLEEALDRQEPDLKQVEDYMVGAVVVAYEPDEAICSNILTYCEDVDILIVYDNSSYPTRFLQEWVKNYPKMRYVFGNAENKGVAGAINKAAQVLRREGYHWMISFDQDDQAGDQMINEMRRFINSKTNRDLSGKIALVTPTINMFDHQDYMPEEMPYMNYIARSPQSGTLINLDVHKKLGGLDEMFMLDYVDHDYCTRCILEGYRIARLTKVSLLHQMQEDHVTEMVKNGRLIFVNKYSPYRYYLKYRNCLIGYKRYKDRFPVVAAEFVDGIDALLFLLQYDTNQDDKRAAIERAMAECDCIKEK